MRYCEGCGTGHECEAQAEGREDPTVAIARINADRDVKVAQISSRQEREWNESREAIAEVEADAAVEVAAVEAEVIGTIIAAEIDATEEPESVIIDAPPVDAEPEADAEELAPVEGSPAPIATSKARGLGMW